MTINERLKHFRENVEHKTPLDLALQMKISQSNYYAYEKGNRGIPDSIYIKLNEIGCDLNWLITGKSYNGKEGVACLNGDNNVINGQNSSQMTAQQGIFGGNQTLDPNGQKKDCKGCSMVENLIEQNKKLTEINEMLVKKLC